jgi:fructose-bisphosphate aldolase class I
MINLNRIAQRGPFPWGLTFSYSRALQDPVLKAWASNPEGVEEAQNLFKQQLAHAAAASKGELDEAALGEDTFVSHSQDL